ncbi:MAG: valine--tRNA ligase [Verrucomicrobiota bacterium]|jgi:valyl-tRNA synthetase
MAEIPKAYEPQAVEEKWYQFWLAGKFFVADPASPKPAYSIVIPPPNVTGVLTMGHVLNNTIQDILARKARMDGKEVLWLPGTDHAGIATQTVVERALKKSGEIKHRDDLGREKFLERVWQWKEKHGGIIIQQLKKLGASCDWTRERFTMDPEYSRCVQKVFVELYQKGLIYRGKRMVNWCPVSLTALSDEEVIMKEQKGSLYYFKVEVVDVGQASRLPQTEKEKNQNGDRRDACPTEDGIHATGVWLTIATTRPETIPGDTAVAVNPKDPRYAKYIGQHIIRPLPPELPREQKLIPIVGDEHVDFEFGTGVLKVTPAHDKADFEIGQRHKLTQIDIMYPNGHMNELAGKDLNGLDRFKARKVATEKLAELGALEKEEPYTNNVGFSERADVPIEPRLSEQWFLKYPSTEKARACVEQADDSERRDSEGRVTRVPNSESQGLAELVPPKNGKMRFHPERWAKVYDHWMGGLQDWCISRQLWWGHRIPVWRRRGFKPNEPWEKFGLNFVATADKLTVDQIDGQKAWYRLVEVDKEILWEAVTYSDSYAKKLEEWGFTQDPDVLDTWFSSWLWPFATMGWPEKTETLKKFYPTNDLVTGPDIIFFWVARMIMAGYEFMGEMPFRDVYFTGIIRDKQGRKMSKSLGNSPDPLDLIGKYGADALRFGTMRSAPLGQDILFDEQNVELGRNFCNKLWNACRFRQMVGSAPASGASAGAPPAEIQAEINPSLLTSDDKWILLKLDAAIREINAAFAEYKFSDATATLYRFFWSEYCDWYVEASKAVLGSAECGVRSAEQEARRANTLAVIDFVLSHTLRLFHPFLPFITEELWQGMGYSDDMPELQGGRTIMFAPWPKPLDDDFKTHYGLTSRDEQHVDARNEMVTQGRNLRRMASLPANKKVKFILKPAREIASHDVEVLKLLLHAEAIELNANYQPAKGVLTIRAEWGGLYLPLAGVDAAAEKDRLTRELQKIEAEIAKVEQKLANPNFTQKVPANVLAEHQQRLADWQAKRAHVKAAIDALGGA